MSEAKYPEIVNYNGLGWVFCEEDSLYISGGCSIPANWYDRFPEQFTIPEPKTHTIKIIVDGNTSYEGPGWPGETKLIIEGKTDRVVYDMQGDCVEVRKEEAELPKGLSEVIEEINTQIKHDSKLYGSNDYRNGEINGGLEAYRHCLELLQSVKVGEYDESDLKSCVDDAFEYAEKKGKKICLWSEFFNEWKEARA